MEKNLADGVEIADDRLIQDLEDSDQRRSQKEIK